MKLLKKKGQGTVEYLLLIGLVIVAIVAVAGTMSGNVSNGMNALAGKVAAGMGGLGQ